MRRERHRHRHACLEYCLLAFLLVWVTPTHASEPLNTTVFGNLAVDGYDAVAYFTAGRAVKGRKQISHEWRDARWRFASEENLSEFKSSPEKYAPQYGGYCAYAMADNRKVDIDPDAFTVSDGELYLNYSKKVRVVWLENQERYIREADQNWSKLQNE